MYPDGGTSPIDATSLRAMKYVRRFRFCITCVLANNSTAIDSEVLKPIAIHFCHTDLNIERAPLEGVDHELDAKNEIHRRANQSVVWRFNQEDARQSKREPRATLERRLPRPLGEAEVTCFVHFCLILAAARHVERRNSAPGESCRPLLYRWLSADGERRSATMRTSFADLRLRWTNLLGENLVQLW